MAVRRGHSDNGVVLIESIHGQTCHQVSSRRQPCVVQAILNLFGTNLCETSYGRHKDTTCLDMPALQKYSPT
jgi:hypothetical protein